MRIGDDPDAHASPTALSVDAKRESGWSLSEESRIAGEVFYSWRCTSRSRGGAHLAECANDLLSQPRLSSVFFRFTARSFRVSSTLLARSNSLLYSFLFFFLSSSKILVTVLDLFFPALLFKNSHRCWRHFCPRRTQVPKSLIISRMFIVAMQSGFVLDLKLFRVTNG
ncbi:hypothetical protein C4D60_Mb03t16060 [Musa balbisiana]|uniref:Uncharacterized protein n=1 Tax=Musa balbisiana TaxID=52838 RepID=A0A4S8JA84_MUSBA|nr:hypothetical protein C4D60_Mb03t16060 [Musa balbisiana]